MSGPPPLVSVLVPTYQHAAYIARCLDGILAQRTGFAIEVLVGEDGSTDGTREVCQRYAEANPGRMRLFLRDRRDVIFIQGRPTGRSNLKRLLADSSGKYVALCEGDDHWLDPLKLQKQVDVLEGDPGLAMCFHNAWVKHAESRKDWFLNHGLDRSRFSLSDIIRREWFIATASMVLRREHVVDAFDDADFCMSGDLLLQLHAARRGEVAYVDEVLSIYHKHGGGLSDSYWRSGGQDHEAWRENMERLRPNHVWMLLAFSRKLERPVDQKAVRARIVELLRMILTWKMEGTKNDPLDYLHLRAYVLDLLESSRPGRFERNVLDPGTLLHGVVNEAAHAVWDEHIEENHSRLSRSGGMLACLRVDLAQYKARALPRRRLLALMANCMWWWIQGLLHRKG